LSGGQGYDITANTVTNAGNGLATGIQVSSTGGNYSVFTNTVCTGFSTPPHKAFFINPTVQQAAGNVCYAGYCTEQVPPYKVCMTGTNNCPQACP
jgi:hypothetical protein